MKTLVVYDSMYGNTEKIGRAIAAAITGEVAVKSAAVVQTCDLDKIDLLVIGSATQGGRALKPTLTLLDSLTHADKKGLKYAAYDTRIKSNFAKIFGYAADKISGALTKQGLKLLLKPEGFIVSSSKGPLAAGELERAGTWAKQVAAEVQK
jgi:flavodoxin